MVQWVKSLLEMQEMQETWVQALSQEDLLEEGLVTYSSILAWRIPWTEEPWDFFERNDVKAEAPVLWPPHAKS